MISMDGSDERFLPRRSSDGTRLVTAGRRARATRARPGQSGCPRQRTRTLRAFAASWASVSMTTLYEQLQPRIGQEVHLSDWLTITQQRIDEFANATGDRQWIHVDPARAAAESPWGTTIAHGYLTLALYPRLRGLVAPEPIYPGVRQVI